ncbi:MAG: glycosyltransferase family 2 protein [Chlamydiae bacterium]|nr:glycosyltransferase family 2 protein [Chlamydiota bacterium]
MPWYNPFLLWSNIIIFLYFLLVQITYLVLLIFAIFELYKRVKEIKLENYEKFLHSDSAPAISLIVPAFNEEHCIVFNVKHLLNLSYRYKEIVVVNDGSTDKTLEILINVFKLVKVAPTVLPKLKTKKVRQYYRSREYPNLIVVDKENGGKVDANNAGINAATSHYFATIDADTVITDQGLEKLIRPFMMTPNTIACGTTIGIANECEIEGNRIKKISFPKSFLPGIQVVEYLRAFLFGRLGWNHLGGCLIISGAFGLFDKEVVIANGGYKLEIGDDVEIIVRLHKKMRKAKKPYVITFIPDLVAMTEAPATIPALFRQRERWHRGLIDVMWRNIDMFFNPRYGKVGMISVPYFVIIESLSPIVEIFGYFIVAISWSLGIINWYFALWYFLLAFGFPLVLSSICMLMADLSFGWYFSLKNIFKIFICSVLEQVGYRQMLVFCRLKAFFAWFKKEKTWKKTTRQVFPDEQA